jgi:hypothetical protein
MLYGFLGEFGGPTLRLKDGVSITDSTIKRGLEFNRGYRLYWLILEEQLEEQFKIYTPDSPIIMFL